MKFLPWIFIFFIIICSKVERISAFSLINNVLFDFDGDEIRPRESFKGNYGKNLLTIGNLGLNRIEKMKPRLMALIKILPNPTRTYFKYFLALCNDYQELHKLNVIIKNIYNFVDDSGGCPQKNSFSIGGMVFSGNSFSSGNAKHFVATTILSDNEKEIRLIFEEQDKADEEREKKLAMEAKKREKEAKRREKKLAREAEKREKKLAEEAAKREKEAERREKKLAEEAERREKKLAEEEEKRAKEAERREKKLAEEAEKRAKEAERREKKLAEEAEKREKKLAEEEEKRAKEAEKREKKLAEEAERREKKLAKEAEIREKKLENAERKRQAKLRRDEKRRERTWEYQ